MKSVLLCDNFNLISITMSLYRGCPRGGIMCLGVSVGTWHLFAGTRRRSLTIKYYIK